MTNAPLLTPSEVVLQLSELGRELDATVRTLRDAELDMVTKRHQADMAESMAFVRASGSMDLRRHTARIEAGPLEEQALVAEAVCRYLKTRIRALELRVEIGRSYGAAVRAELAALPYDPEK